MNILKYPGGKESELNIIKENTPNTIRNFYDPFVGGGSVYLGIDGERYFINDKSTELINLYKCIQQQDPVFFKTLKDIDYNWALISKIANSDKDIFIDIYYRYRNCEMSDMVLSDTIEEYILRNTEKFNGMFQTTFNFYIERFICTLNKSIHSKIKRMDALEKKKGSLLSNEDILKNIECSIKAAFYNHFRYIYNNLESLNKGSGFDAAVYLFIREMCYSSMFRYNSRGQFNVPYGGISYSNKSFCNRIKDYTNSSVLDRFNKTKIGCMDFFDFMSENKPSKDDFVFIDPPYDTAFSTYAKNLFGQSDQQRLADYLLNRCDANFMVIIKKTELTTRLYPAKYKCKNENELNVDIFAKKYAVNFKNRNEQNVEHLIITNYKE